MSNQNSDPPGSASLSVLTQEAIGGRVARAGFRLQDRYAALLVPELLREPSFLHLATEVHDDIEVHHENGAVRRVQAIQVKGGDLSRTDLRDVVTSAQAKFGGLLAGHEFDRLIVAARFPKDDVRRAFEALADARATLPHALPAAVEPTRATLRARFTELGLGEHFDFIERHAHLDTNFHPLERDSTVAEFIAAKLTTLVALSGGRLTPDLVEAGWELIRSFGDQPRRSWTRSDLISLIQGAIGRGSPTSPKRLLRIRHESFATAGQQVVLPPSLDALASSLVTVSTEVDQFQPSTNELERAASVVAQRGGLLRKELVARPDEELLYYGFPHVPFAMLAGRAIGSQRWIYVLEHDLETKRFEWRESFAMPAVSTQATPGIGDCVRLRVAVSAPVDVALCDPGESVGLDLHVAADSPRRGLVAADAIARAVSNEIRAALQEHVEGKKYRAIHVFAAVPVSVAVLMGQLFASNILPPAFAYNFVSYPQPKYNWRISLSAACAGNPSAAIVP